MTTRLTQLLQFQKDQPDDSFVLFALAKEYEKSEKMDEALNHYLQLKERDPDYVGTYYHLGKLYEHFAKIDEAFETYTTGMAVAKAAGDQHSLNELAGARLGVEE